MCAGAAGSGDGGVGVSVAPDASPLLARELLRCRATKDFQRYALRRGATVSHPRHGSSHCTVEANGVKFTLASTGSKHDLMNSARKATFQAFARMGKAHDPRKRNQRGGT
jgi:hypothetical protein